MASSSFPGSLRQAPHNMIRVVEISDFDDIDIGKHDFPCERSAREHLRRNPAEHGFTHALFDSNANKLD